MVWNYVKPGGKLIYSTCTIDHLENEDQRNWILETLPLEPVSIEGGVWQPDKGRNHERRLYPASSGQIPL